MPKKLRVGILGYGRMGREFVAAMQESELWDVVSVYDIWGQTRRLARQQLPNAAIYDDSDAIFGDASIDAVGLFTLARCAAAADSAGSGKPEACTGGEAHRPRRSHGMAVGTGD
jgi:hypothetical protein